MRTELEQVTSALRVFDDQVDYATIHLSIEEVKEFTEAEPENIWQRIGTGFTKSLKGVGKFLAELFVLLIVALPYLALIAIIVLAVVCIVRFRRKRRERAQAQEKNSKQDTQGS